MNTFSKTQLNTVVVLIGGNQGNRYELLKEACQLLQERIGNIKKASSIYETEPWGFSAEQDFLNQALVIETTQRPLDVLRNALLIETELGRQRKENSGYASRTMDIDILYFNTEIYHLPELEIPHPRISQRRFVLLPLNEILPDFVDPILQKTIANLLATCQDQSVVKA